MGKYLDIQDASALTGRPPEELRRIVLGVMARGSDAEQELVKKTGGGSWTMHTDLLEELVKMKPPKAGTTNGKHSHHSQLVDIIAEQLKTKDEQISKMQEQMTQMIERNREMNVMLHNLQQHVALMAENGNGGPTWETGDEDIQPNEQTPDRESPTSFAEWARRFS